MATKLEGGGKALVAGPLRKGFFLRLSKDTIINAYIAL